MIGKVDLRGVQILVEVVEFMEEQACKDARAVLLLLQVLKLQLKAGQLKRKFYKVAHLRQRPACKML
jgi:hypothetical protein